jgi:pimeloyl-ACP methyl ester carboxylesterase
MPTARLKSGINLSYEEQGDVQSPVLVLVPGPTDSWLSYRPVLDHLPRSIRVIAVSQRGHGDSDKPETGYQVQDFAADVVLLLDALGVRKAVLAGHSGSCLVARRVAIDHPERVTGLILEASPTTLRGHSGLESFVSSVVAGLEDPIRPDMARAFVVDTSSQGISPDVIDELAQELLKVPARVWRAMFEDLLRYDDTPELAQIRAPTLMLWGDADAVVSSEMQDRLAASIPNATLKVYAGVGHTPRWEHPSRFSADVAAFINSLNAPN